MTEPTPFAPVPMDTPADHPMLDTISADLRDFAKAGPSGSELAAALAVLAQAGISLPTPVPPPLLERDERHRCHRCDEVATAQWARQATADEAEAWHAGREQHIRAHNDGRAAAEYVSDRSDTVTMAVHGCDDHDLSPGAADETNAAKHEARRIGEDRRALTHDADCGGHGACGCGGNE